MQQLPRLEGVPVEPEGLEARSRLLEQTGVLAHDAERPQVEGRHVRPAPRPRSGLDVATPGVAVFRVNGSGRTGELQAIVRIDRVVDGVNRADPHGIAIRRK